MRVAFVTPLKGTIPITFHITMKARLYLHPFLKKMRRRGQRVSFRNRRKLQSCEIESLRGYGSLYRMQGIIYGSMRRKKVSCDFFLITIFPFLPTTVSIPYCIYNDCCICSAYSPLKLSVDITHFVPVQQPSSIYHTASDNGCSSNPFGKIFCLSL